MRLALGVEHLRLMNIFYRDEDCVTKAIDNRLLVDMAGNAFDTTCFLAVFMTLLVVLASAESRSPHHCSVSEGNARAEASLQRPGIDCIDCMFDTDVSEAESSDVS